MTRTRVAVLRGGPSSEYEISLKSGANAIGALRKANYFVKDVVITRNGEWLVDGVVRSPGNIMSDIDVALIALHGEYGEDGTIQRILDTLRVPYTGSGPMPSGIAMNKLLTKARLIDLGVRMPRHVRLTKGGATDIVRTAQGIAQMLGPEFIIKPERGGSSIGTYLVKSEAELPSVIEAAFEVSPELLVEERIVGKEATVAVMENFRNEELYLFPPVEIVPPEGEFFSLEAKYSGKTEERVPGNFSRLQKDKLGAIAHKVHTTLELRHYSRSDFIVAPDGIYFLEVNTLPGLTDQSLFPKAAEAVGLSYTELLAHLITLAQTTKR